MYDLPTIEQINKAKQKTLWDFGNKVLYDLCRNNFNHEQGEKTLAKVWLIGRAYSVAIERRKNKKDINDNFYIGTVIPAFNNSKLDELLKNLKMINRLTTDNLSTVLEVHQYLTKIISHENFTAQNKRSFCSKYLHFHLPNLFFMYDSRSITALRQFRSRVPKDLACYTKLDNVDEEYAKYFCKCFDLKRNIIHHFKTTITNRQLDNLLIDIANKIIRKKNS